MMLKNILYADDSHLFSEADRVAVCERDFAML